MRLTRLNPGDDEAAPAAVRPWGLAVPVLVLLVCLPLLRPLRHPDPTLVSREEAARLATAAALVETGSLVLDEARIAQVALPAGGSNETLPLTSLRSGQRVADQPPMLATLIALAYWPLHAAGLSLENNPILVPYLLTLAGATLPVAAVAAMAYRLGRLFELGRRWRAALAAAVVFGSGLIAYGTVINPHAPSAALLVAAIACMVHVERSPHPSRDGAWLLVAGGCAATAAFIEPAAAMIALLLAAATLALRWEIAGRIGAVILLGIGAMPVILLHLTLVSSVTGAWTPATIAAPTAPRTPGAVSPMDEGWIDDTSFWSDVGLATGRLISSLLGGHGVLTHFPLVVIGAVGGWLVLRRHWPPLAKALAGAVLLALLANVTLVTIRWEALAASPTRMFGPEPMMVLLPLVMLFAGAWLREPGKPKRAWTTAAILGVMSVTVATIGAANPQPPGGYRGWSVAGAAAKLLSPQVTPRPPTRSMPTSAGASLGPSDMTPARPL